MKYKKILFVFGLVCTMFTFSACGKNEDSTNNNTPNQTVASESESKVESDKEATLDISDDELSEQYAEILDYAMFLEQEVIRLNEEVRTLKEQNDILQGKLENQ